MLSARYLLLVTSLLIFCHCGKHETASGVMGTASGVAVGTAVAGKKSKGTGALLGALVGGYLGGATGRSVDKHEQAQDERDAHRMREMRRERAELRQERRQLRTNIKKRLTEQANRWCLDCSAKVRVPGAVRCPDCGTRLVREKVCNKCYACFNPQSSYRYCPYCENRVLLSYR